MNDYYIKILTTTSLSTYMKKSKKQKDSNKKVIHCIFIKDFH